MPVTTRAQHRRRQRALQRLVDLYKCHRTDILNRKKLVEEFREKQTKKQEELFAKLRKERECIICLDYYSTVPHTLEQLAFVNIFRQVIWKLRKMKPRSSPSKMSCCRQWVHDKCLYTFLMMQYGYVLEEQRSQWKCPHCRASIFGRSRFLNQVLINP